MPPWNILKFKDSAFCQTWLIMAVCAVLYWLGPISTWETNDDVYYNLIFSGKLLTSAPDAHALVVNYGLSTIFVMLYKVAPSIPWYGLFHVAAIFSAIFSLNYCYAVVRDNSEFIPRLIVSVVCFLPFLFYLQFTKTALVLGVAGCLKLCLLSEGSPRAHRHDLLLHGLAVAFLVMAFSLRKESLLLASMLCGLLLAKALWNRRRRLIMALGATALLVLVLALFHRQNHGADWQQFFAVSELAGPLIDYDQYGYQANKDVYDEVGWSSNDYYFFRLWGHVDEKVYSPERVRYFLDHARKSQAAHQMLPILAGAVDFPARNYLLTIAVVTVALLVACRQKHLWTICLVFLPLFVCIAALAWDGRFPPRVSTAMACFLPWGILIQSEGLRRRLVVGIVAAVGAVAIALPLYEQYRDLSGLAEYRVANNHDLRQLQRRVSPAPQTLVTVGSVFPYEGILPFETVDYLPGVCVIWFCGMNQSPVQKKQLTDNRIEDIFLTLMDNKTAYIVIDPMQAAILQRYLQEHYRRLVGFAPVYTGIDFTMYRLVNLSFDWKGNP